MSLRNGSGALARMISVLALAQIGASPVGLPISVVTSSQSTTWSSRVDQTISTCQALGTGTKVSRTNMVPIFTEPNFSRGHKQKTCNYKIS